MRILLGERTPVFAGMLTVYLGVSAALGGVAFGQGRAKNADPFLEDRRTLLRGVEEIGSPGVPGPLCVVGEKAFSVVGGESRGGILETVVAAAHYGRGRVVAFGHGGYFSREELRRADNERLLLNALGWVAGASGSRKIRVGVHQTAKLAPFLRERGFVARLLGTPEDFEKLGELDVVLTAPNDFDVESSRRLRRFVLAGGGLLFGGLGWGWSQLHPDEDLIHDHPGNVLLGGAGILWADGTLQDTGPSGFLVEDETVVERLHAGRSLDFLIRHTDEKGRAQTGADLKALSQAAAVIGRAIRTLPPDSGPFRGRLETVRKARRITNRISKERPLGEKDVLGRVVASLEAVDAAWSAPDGLDPHPSAEVFPGSVPRAARRVRRSVRIATEVPGWHSTGLYAPAGEVLRVEIARDVVDRGLRLRIGAHKDRLWHKEQWRRFPEVTRVYGMETDVTFVGCAFGGLVYVEVPEGLEKDIVEVSISGGVEAPRFVLGVTEKKRWRQEIRLRKAPWAELESEKIILTVPSETIRELDDPKALLETWDQISDACRDLVSLPPDRERPERFVADEQISAGYMHAGYPIMTHLDAGPRMVSVESLISGSWGLYHELGHNHQDPRWTFSGTGEVTCNLFTLYVYEKVCGIGIRDEANRPDFRGEKRAKILGEFQAEGAQFEEWKKRPFLALLMYIQLREEFGWKVFQKVFQEYGRLGADRSRWSDARKRDEWLLRFSKAAGRNLGPFFEKWGVPTSEEARARIASLPVWLPDEISG